MKHMKQIFAAGLAAVMCAAMCGCGSGSKNDEQAFAIADQAFSEIDAVYQMIDEYGSTVYKAWMTGIYDHGDNEMTASHLASELGMTTQNIVHGYNVLVDEYISEFFDQACLDIMFNYKVNEEDLFSLYVDIVNTLYVDSGKSAEIKEHLDTAKSLIKEMSEKYSDYEHYSNLKGYYTTANAFFEWCESPSGSFEQAKTTINDYRNDARNYRNDLAFIFED